MNMIVYFIGIFTLSIFLKSIELQNRKFWNFLSEDLLPIINMIVNDWIKTKTVQERDTMIKQAKIAKAIVMFGCIMMSFASVALIIPPCFGYSIRYLTNLTDGAKPLLFQTYYLRDMTESPYYEIVFVAQATSIIMAAISYTGIDNFLGLLVFHICAQLDILKVRLLNLNDFKSFSTGLSFNIEDHLRLIRLFFKFSPFKSSVIYTFTCKDLNIIFWGSNYIIFIWFF